MTSTISNLFPLPVYDSIEKQARFRKWWVKNNYPLFRTAVLPVQFSFFSDTSLASVLSVGVSYRSIDGTQLIYQIFRPIIVSRPYKGGYLINIAIAIDILEKFDYIGEAYLEFHVGDRLYYSEVFTLIDSAIEGSYLRIEWRDRQNLVADNNSIVYNDSSGKNVYSNVLLLASDIAKPEYVYTEEGQELNGYFNAEWMTSAKQYRFTFLAPEYLLDSVRLLPLADIVEITYSGKTYTPQRVTLDSEWDAAGDVATVTVTFETDTVVVQLNKAFASSTASS